jgi:hypothetical protein
MLESMVDCAHALGMAFGAAAQAEADPKHRLELFDAFQKSFLALRMGIRLSMVLRAPPKATPQVAGRAEAPEREPAEHDPPERSDSAERERDRDYEPVSLPKFLATLGVVARDAARLDDRLPARAATRVLPTLQNLLARATADPPASEPGPGQAAPVLAHLPRSGTRHMLLGSVSAPSPRPGPRPRRPWPNSG